MSLNPDTATILILVESFYIPSDPNTVRIAIPVNPDTPKYPGDFTAGCGFGVLWFVSFT